MQGTIGETVGSVVCAIVGTTLHIIQAPSPLMFPHFYELAQEGAWLTAIILGVRVGTKSIYQYYKNKKNGL